MVIESIYSEHRDQFATARQSCRNTSDAPGRWFCRTGGLFALQMGGSIGNQIEKWLKLMRKIRNCGHVHEWCVCLVWHTMAAAIFRWRLSALCWRTMRWFHVSFSALRRRWRGSGDRCRGVCDWCGSCVSIETAIVAVGLAAGCALVGASRFTTEPYKISSIADSWILSGAAIVIVLTLRPVRPAITEGVPDEKCFEGEGFHGIS